MKNNRREFLKSISALSLVTTVGFTSSFGITGSGMSEIKARRPLRKIGLVKIITPKDIGESPLGIGCETLDRDLWKPKEIFPWMDHLPVKWARLQTGWARVEKVRGQYDWSWLDESVNGLVKRGFKPFFNVGYGNPNYTEGDTGYYPMVSDEAIAAWKKFITELVLRYKGRIEYFELWNEPNLSGFWKPTKPDPAKYVELVKLTAPVIRENYPEAKIIGGVVSRLPFDFIRSLFDNGLGKEIDIFSFHPYGTRPEDYIGPIRKLRMLIDEYNPAIRIWQGENGYPSQPNSSGFVGEAPWTENVQAKFMLRRQLLDCSLGIDMTLWFLIVDIHDYPKGSGKVNYKGILRVKPVVQPKVAFKAMQNIGSIINGKVKSEPVVVGFSENGKNLSVLTSQSDNSENGEQSPGIYSTLLSIGRGTVLAYWDTSRAADEYTPRNIDLVLSGTSFNGFRNPVLVDLLSGDVFELGSNAVKGQKSKEILAFQQLPLADYPMLIVERNNLEYTNL